jgi:hypothetical protein
MLNQEVLEKISKFDNATLVNVFTSQVSYTEKNGFEPEPWEIRQALKDEIMKRLSK